MSFQAMGWAVSQGCQNAGEKLVLIMLANYCNSHTGRCNPSHRRLADECSMGVSTLKRHLSRLEDAGYLKVVALSSDGVSLPNQYDLLITQTEVGGSKLDGGSVQIGLGVGPDRATNLELNQESNLKNTPAPRADELLSDVGEDIRRDFIQMRKGMRAPITETAVKGLRREAAKAGMTLESVVALCCEKTWRGFEASWLDKARSNGSGQTASSLPAGGGRKEL